MYIGPWQEYRLAKIQDEAIQQLKQQLEKQFKDHQQQKDQQDTYRNNVERIQEMMQGITLPSLVMNNPKAKTDTSATSLVHRRFSIPRRSSSSRSTASNVSTPVEKQGGNQQTHEVGEDEGDDDHDDDSDVEESTAHSIVARRTSTKKKSKKKKVTKMTALEQVQRRKKMFAKWIKDAGTGSKESDTSSTTKLPPVHNDNTTHLSNHAPTFLPQAQQRLPHDAVRTTHEQVHLPSIIPSATVSVSSVDEPDYLKPYQETLSSSSHTEAETAVPDVDFEDSLDEDAVNDLLNWTGTLLSPSQIDF